MKFHETPFGGCGADAWGRTDLHDDWAYSLIRNRTCVKNARVEGFCLETLADYVNCCVF